MENNIEISPYGNMLVYKKGYLAEDVYNFISKNNLSGLRIFDHLHPLDSLDFLKQYDFLEKIDIDCIYDQDFDFLKHLKKLKSLGIGVSIKNKNLIDLSSLINLENLSIQWRQNIKGIEFCEKLNYLCLVDLKEINLQKISLLKSLKELKIKTSSISTLDGIDNLINLEKVLIANCKKLISVKEISGLQNLTSLEFETCAKVQDFNLLNNIPKLDRLFFTDCGAIDSIKFIKNFPLLKEFALLGNTKIIDGDMLPAKFIKSVVYKHYDNYNIRIENPEHEKLMEKNLKKIKSMFK